MGQKAALKVAARLHNSKGAALDPALRTRNKCVDFVFMAARLNGFRFRERTFSLTTLRLLSME